MCKLRKEKINYVRSGIRTHAYISRLRPERSSLDHSAILTYLNSSVLPPFSFQFCSSRTKHAIKELQIYIICL